MVWVREQWRWVATAMVVVFLGAGAAAWLRRPGPAPVSVEQAQRRAGPVTALAPGDGRPQPGVYLYDGSGRDRLSLPPVSQSQGPTMPGTVTVGAPGCWTLRIDYSTHHWQTWDYCRRGSDLVRTGGRFWQVWDLGPFSVTNLTSISCSPPAMVLPADPRVGQTWATGCGGTSTAVSGSMRSAGTLTYLGTAEVDVAGRAVPTEHFVETRTDTGSQQGSERVEAWLAPGTGLPVRLRQTISVTTSTPFGRSTYTQDGTATLASLRPQ